MSKEDIYAERRIADFPHFDRETRKLSSCLNIDRADETHVWVAVVGNPKEIKGGKTRVSTKLSFNEVASLYFRLKNWLENG